MKKLVLLLAVALVFSCSKDSIDTQTTADLSQTIAESTAQEFSGVFGHHLNNDLHGKIYITVDGNASYANINLINGEVMQFQGSQLNQDATTIHFNGNRGSFTFDALAEDGSRVSDMVIGNVSDAYVVSIEVATRGGGWILLGTYEQDIDATWNGNWDMMGDGVMITKFGADAQLVAMTVITHRSGFVIVDASSEVQVGACTGGDPDTFLWDPVGDVATGGNPSVFSHFQTTSILGIDSNWGVEYRRDLGEQSYVDDICVNIIPSGSWSWAGRTGTIVASEPVLFSENNQTTRTTNTSLKLK